MKLTRVLSVAVVSACSSPSSGLGAAGGTMGAGTDTRATSAGPTTAAPTTTEDPGVADDSSATTRGPIFDVGLDPASTGDPPVSNCKVSDEMNAVGTCRHAAPPDSFSPEVQWSWAGMGDEVYAVVTPLVANLTDDNGDGAIDLCDVPDVVVIAWANLLSPGHIYLLDGRTGAAHPRFETGVLATSTPALGDIDGDGQIEIVATLPDARLVAFDHEGDVQWRSTVAWRTGAFIGALALADLDNDGDVEILAGNQIFDHNGVLVRTFATDDASSGIPTAADLDGDGDLEVIFGNSAYHHGGTRQWLAPIGDGYPQVADLDGDGRPEILVTGANGLSLVEHNGAVTYSNRRPTDDEPGGLTWVRPATIHDFDGDGRADFAMSSANHYTVYRADATVMWSSDVRDASGVAAGTAFDFLGDGVAEAMYADEVSMFVFDGMGDPLLTIARTSRTGTEFPVVADVDNDGSAEIIVVSNESVDGAAAAGPTVQVIGDVDDRWIQARRIWNQHTYHVTNVREDGTIPQFEPPSWELLNTFRTNAQIEGGDVCNPTPAG